MKISLFIFDGKNETEFADYKGPIPNVGDIVDGLLIAKREFRFSIPDDSPTTYKLLVIRLTGMSDSEAAPEDQPS